MRRSIRQRYTPPATKSRWTFRHSVFLVVLLYVLSVAAINGWSWLGTGQWMRQRIEGMSTRLPTQAPLRGRVVVISPHPDDETLAVAGIIQDVQQHGGRVSLIFLTNGDGFPWDARVEDRRIFPDAETYLKLGRRRMKEAQQASHILGVAPDQVYFLGFPDRGLTSLYLQNYILPYTSKYTHVQAVPYQKTYKPNAPYTGFELKFQLNSLLKQLNPDIILTPTPLDGHPDHRAAAYFTTDLWANNYPQAELYYYLVHGGVEWPLPKGNHPQLPLSPPTLTQLQQTWHSYDLSTTQQVNKRLAIQAYPSQLRILKRFMWAFARTNELLLPVPEVSHDRP